jgi:hypothetical protein
MHIELQSQHAPEGVKVLQLGQEQLKEGEDYGPPGQRTGAVPVGAPRAHRLVHSIVARAAVHRLRRSTHFEWNIRLSE